MTEISDTGMVLAAGFGKRMRPLTLQKPKPLFEVGGRTMLDHALDKLVRFGTKRAVVNVHYLPDQIIDHLASRKDIEIIISDEAELLDTGGGIKKAISYFDNKPFFSLNADLPWMDGSMPSLSRMAKAWDSKKMDALLLLMPTNRARGFSIKGDFEKASDGHIGRKNLPPPLPFVWISAQIIKPQLYVAQKDKIFSNNVIWNEIEERRMLHGIEHDFTCYHVGTPEDLVKANELLLSGQGWEIKG